MSLIGKRLWSDDFVSAFVKDFIKHDVLIKAYLQGWKGTKVEKLQQSVALYYLTRDTGLKVEESEMVKMCNKLRIILMTQMRRLVKRCLARGWPAERALLMAPMWLRTAETKLCLLPAAIKMESNFKCAPNPKVTTFNTNMVENAVQAVKNGIAIYDPQVVGDLGKYYNVSDESILHLWKRTCMNMQYHLIAMCQAGDSPQHSFITDWRVADLLLLNDFSFRIVTKASISHLGQLQGLLELYKIIVKKNVEELSRNKSPDLVKAWMNVYATYSYSSTNISLILLQRRWYELKLEARTQVLSYWKGEGCDPVPHPLLLSIVTNFRYVILEPFPSWTDLVKSGQVVEMEDVSKEVYSTALQEAQEERGKEVSTCICIDDCDNEFDKEINKLNLQYMQVSSDEDEPQLVIDDSSSSKTIEKAIVSQDIEQTNKEKNAKTNEHETLVQNKDTKDEDNSKKMNSIVHNDIDTEDKIAKTLERSMDVDTNINILNTIDPTKAQIQLIFDSDSEHGDDISNTTSSNGTFVNNKTDSVNNNPIANDVLQYSQTKTNDISSIEKDVSNKDNNKTDLKNNNPIANDVMQAGQTQSNDSACLEKDLRQTKEESVVTETTIDTSLETVSEENKKNRVGTRKKYYVTQTIQEINKENVETNDVKDPPITDKMNVANETDPKLLLNTIVPLVRCDLTPSWKRHYRNKSINVRNVDICNFLPVKHNLLKQKPKIQPILKKAAPKRVYSPQALVNNPDFNISLKKLSKKFFNSMKNRRLLNMCNPLIVVLERLSTINTKSTPDTKLRRITRKIELQNIEDVREINKTILTAQVAPITVDSSVKCCNMVLDGSKTAESDGHPSDVTSGGSKTSPDETAIQNTKTNTTEIDLCGADNTPSHSELKSLLKNLWSRVNETSNGTGAMVTKGDSKSAEKKSSLGCRCGSVAFTEYQGNELTDMMNKYHEQFVMEERRLSKEIFRLLKCNYRVPTNEVKANSAQDKQKEPSKLLDEDKGEESEDNEGETTDSAHDSDSTNLKITNDKETNKNLDTTQGNVSDSDEDNIKLSIVVDNIRKKKKRRICKRKKDLEQEQEKDLHLAKKQCKNNEGNNSKDKPAETCLDEYQEWLRQKSLGLQYFSIPMAKDTKKRGPLSKKSAKKSKRTEILQSETSQELNETTDNGPVQNYSNEDQNNSFFSRYKDRAFLRKVLQNINVVDTAVIDLTEGTDNQNKEEIVTHDSRPTSITIEQNNNATYTLASVGTQPKQSNTLPENMPSVFNSYDSASASNDVTSEGFTPIITGVCSLANTQFLEDTNPIATDTNRIEIRPMHQIPSPMLSVGPTLVHSDTQVKPIQFSPVNPPSIKSTPLTVNSVQSLPAQQSNSVQYGPLSPILVPIPGENAAAQVPPSLQTAAAPISISYQTALPQIPTSFQSSMMQPTQSTSLQAVPTDADTVPFVHIGTIKTNGGGYFLLVPQMLQQAKIAQGQSKIAQIITPTPQASSQPNQATPNRSILVKALTEQHLELRPKPSTDVGLVNLAPSEPPVETQRHEMMAKPVSRIPCMPVALWAQRRPRHALTIMRLDASRKLWTIDKHLIVTELDIPCEKPEYWSISPPQSRHRILFPAEKDGSHVFDPLPVHVNEDNVREGTSFSEWIKSMTNPNEETIMADPSNIASNIAAENETVAKEIPNDSSNKVEDTITTQVGDASKNDKPDTDAGPSQPAPRLKVKSFARLGEAEIQKLNDPERIFFQGKLYQKLSDQPLAYAKILTVVPSKRQCSSLLAINVPLYSLSPTSNSFVPLEPKLDKALRRKAQPEFFVRASNTGVPNEL